MLPRFTNAITAKRTVNPAAIHQSRPDQARRSFPTLCSFHKILFPSSSRHLFFHSPSFVLMRSVPLLLHPARLSIQESDIFHVIFQHKKQFHIHRFPHPVLQKHQHQRIKFISRTALSEALSGDIPRPEYASSRNREKNSNFLNLSIPRRALKCSIHELPTKRINTASQIKSIRFFPVKEQIIPGSDSRYKDTGIPTLIPGFRFPGQNI